MESLVEDIESMTTPAPGDTGDDEDMLFAKFSMPVCPSDFGLPYERPRIMSWLRTRSRVQLRAGLCDSYDGQVSVFKQMVCQRRVIDATLGAPCALGVSHPRDECLCLSTTRWPFDTEIVQEVEDCCNYSLMQISSWLQFAWCISEIDLATPMA